MKAKKVVLEKMLNNYTVTIGFMSKEPVIEEDKRQGRVCIFKLVTTDHGKTKEVPCMATGKICDTLLVYGQKGSFWAIGGIFSEYDRQKSARKNVALKCLEIELLKKPEVPGISVKEFVGKYAPKEIIKKAKENRNAKKKS